MGSIKKKQQSKNFNLMIALTFFIGILLITATYAWFASSLNVKLNFFNMVVANDSGLFISFDGVDFQSSVQMSKKTLIDDLKNKYPNNTNQWASKGLYPVSSSGIPDNNADKFDVFGNYRIEHYFNGRFYSKVMTTKQISEAKADENNYFIAFDMFLKNISGSPMSDNLYLKNGTTVYIDTPGGSDADGTINSMRIGMVKMATTKAKADPEEIQKLKCDGMCEMMIYEPNSRVHSKESIERAKKRKITLLNGKKSPTFSVRKEGSDLKITNGHVGTNIPLDHQYFTVQNTITELNKPIFKLPNGITKFRVYIWLEGQDADSLETLSKGTKISININLYKDTAGYEYYN